MIKHIHYVKTKLLDQLALITNPQNLRYYNATSLSLTSYSQFVKMLNSATSLNNKMLITKMLTVTL